MNHHDTRVPVRSPLAGGLASEALKLRTLPLNGWLAGLTLLFIIAPGALLAISRVTALADPRNAGRVIEARPIEFVDSVLWAQLLIALIAVLAATNEYGSGQARLSLLALPTRWPWLLAKASAVAVLAFVIGVVGAGASLALSALILGGSEVIYPFEIGEAASLALRSGLYLAGIAVLSVGIATMLRHVVAALIALLLLLVVAPPVLNSIEAVRWSADYTPTISGRRLISDLPTLAELTPWAGYGILAIWAVLALVSATLLLKARDA